MKLTLALVITALFAACAPHPTKMNALIDQYLSPQPAEQAKAREDLLKIGKHSTKPVISRIDVSELNEQRKLALLLGGLGAPRNEVISKLGSLTKSEEPSLREAAALALGKISPPDSGVVSLLTPLLSDPEPRVRAAAATSLGTQDYLATSSVPQLSKLVSDRDAYVSNSALQALVRLNPNEAANVAKKYSAKIIQRLESDSTEVRLGSAFLIAQLPILHKQAESAVLSRLNREPAPVIKAQLASTLLRINSKESLRAAHPALVELAKGTNSDAKRIAEQALLYLASLYPQHFNNETTSKK